MPVLDRHTLLDISCPKIFKIVYDDDLEALRKIDSTDVNREFSFNLPLFICKSVEATQILIERGADVNRTTRNKFHVLSRVYDPKIMKCLIDNGADVNYVGYEGQTPLFACKNAESAELLIKAGARINHTDSGGKTALFYARSVSIAKVLIKAGLDPHQKTMYGDDVPSSVPSPHVLRYLDEIGVDIRSSGVNYFSKYYGLDGEKVKCLFDLGFRPDTTKNDILSECVDAESIHLLIKAGVPLFSRKNSFSDEYDLYYTPLFYAKTVEAAKTFIEYGCDPFALDEDGKNILFYISNVEVASYLIDIGVDINHLDDGGSCAFDVTEWTEMMGLFILKGGSMNLSEYFEERSDDFVHPDYIRALIKSDFNFVSRGSNLLLHAVSENVLESVKLLLKKGANPYVEDDGRKRVFDLCRSDECRKLLEEYLF